MTPAIATRPKPGSSAQQQQQAGSDRFAHPGTPSLAGGQQLVQPGGVGGGSARDASQTRVTQMRPNPGEILGRFAPFGQRVSDHERQDILSRARAEVVVRAMEDGMSLTSWLEEVDPSTRYSTSDPLGQMDAYERQLYLAGIRTQSDPRKGIYAHTVERFYASDQPASPILFPEFINRQVRVALIVPPILEDIIAITTPVDSDSYRAIYLQDTTATRQMRRVAEAAEFPTIKVLTSEKSISLHKYGVKISGSYEAFRRMKIDLFALHLARIALQTQLDKSLEALSVAINGDGNSNPATNWNLTALDSSTTAGNLTYKAWLRWALKLWPYQLNTVVAGEAEMLSILTLQFPNINPMMLLAMLGEGGPVGQKLSLSQSVFSNINLVYFPYAPANILTGLNKQTALEMVQEVGASLTETDRIINKQLNEITLSEVVGFAVLMTQGIETLTLNA